MKGEFNKTAISDFDAKRKLKLERLAKQSNFRA